MQAQYLNSLMASKGIGAFPNLTPTLTGTFSAIGAGGMASIAGFQLSGGHPQITALFALVGVIALFVAYRYTEFAGEGNNGGWHWLTEPPSELRDKKRRGKIDVATTEILQRKTGNTSLVAEESRSNQYRILIVNNDDPGQLDKDGIRSAIAISNGIKNPEAVKFIPVHDVGRSAFLLPLPKEEWTPVPFDEDAIQAGKPVVQLGLDLNGKPLSVDLKANPHTIVAGMTGSGKTAWMMVYIQSLIKSGLDPIIYILDPNDNLGVFYEDCRESGGAYITDLDEGASVLRRLTEDPPPKPEEDAPHKEHDAWALKVSNMHHHNFATRKRRFKGAQNLWSFRSKGGTGEDARPVVFVVDEAAAYTVHPDKELKKQVVADLGTIARRYRAAGVLLLVATQRPSSDILPGEFKSNCGNIIAFSHANKISSRVTLDSGIAAGIPGLGGFVAKFGGSEEFVFGRAAYLDL